MEKLIIEVLSRGGHFLERLIFESDTISVGRAPDNDIIISDPFVDQHHLVITRDESAWEVRDLGSTNGLFVGKKFRSADSINVDSSESIRIGETRLNIFTSSHPVEPAVQLPPARDFIHIISSPFFAWPFVVVLLAFITFGDFLQTSSPFQIEKALARNIPIVIAPMIWAGIWAIIGRVFRHKASFSLHMSIGTIALFLFIVIDDLSSFFEYITNSGSAKIVFLYVLLTTLGAATLSFSLSLVTQHLGQKIRWTASFSVIFALSLVIAFMNHADNPEFQSFPSFSETLKPPLFQWTPTTSVEPFISDTIDLFDDLGKTLTEEQAEPDKS